MQDISCLVLPIPAHAFFKQAVLQGEIGHDLLQGRGLSTKVLHLAGRCGAGRVARQPALAGLEELLRPAVIHRSGDAFTAAKLRDVLLTAQPFQHDANLLFRRVLPAFFSTCSAGALSGPDFCFIFAPCGYDEPEILPSGSPSIGPTGADGGQPKWRSTAFVSMSRAVTITTVCGFGSMTAAGEGRESMYAG